MRGEDFVRAVESWVGAVPDAGADASDRDRTRLVVDFDDFDVAVAVSVRVRDAHVGETVVVVHGVVEPGAVAGFPGGGADHAELGGAAAARC